MKSLTIAENIHVKKIVGCIGKTVRHFKGDLYLINNISEDTETHKIIVNYTALYGGCKKYSRPLEMFAEKTDMKKWPNATQKYRFEPIMVESVKSQFEKEAEEMLNVR